MYTKVVMQTSLENVWSVNSGQLLGLDGPYLTLLGPLLASPASGLTPSTCGNPVSPRPKQIFDQKYFREFFNRKVACSGPKLASYGLETVIERSASKFCPVLVPMTSQSDFVVQFHEQITIEKSGFILVCSTKPDTYDHIWSKICPYMSTYGKIYVHI